MNYNFDFNEYKYCQKKEIKISSIGGGSGNDALAIALPINQHNPSLKIKIEIYDLNFEAWQKSTSIQYKSYFKNRNIDFCWKFIDHSQDKYDYNSLNSDFITIAWTLNESIKFNKKFWEKFFIHNTQSKIVIVEGSDENMSKIMEIIKIHFNKIVYEKYSNPRKIYAFNK